MPCWMGGARSARIKAILVRAFLMSLLLVSGAMAQCLPIASTTQGVLPAALPAAGEVRLTYLDHSSFLIETAGGASAVTDYNGVHRVPDTPEIVTMNNAHSTHFTDHVEPGVHHVLRGWDPAGGVARHDVIHEDLRIRNVPTNVREAAGTRYNGNSIFVFEVADLCIAHLGHLHHTLSDVHLGELGMIDVLLVPVDGSYTLAQELMVEVIRQINPTIVIPMHYFSRHRLERFLSLLGAAGFEAIAREGSTVTLARDRLPYRKAVILPPSSPFSGGFP